MTNIIIITIITIIITIRIIIIITIIIIIIITRVRLLLIIVVPSVGWTLAVICNYSLLIRIIIYYYLTAYMNRIWRTSSSRRWCGVCCRV